jgi:hypothetical protein
MHRGSIDLRHRPGVENIFEEVTKRDPNRQYNGENLRASVYGSYLQRRDHPLITRLP